VASTKARVWHAYKQSPIMLVYVPQGDELDESKGRDAYQYFLSSVFNSALNDGCTVLIFVSPMVDSLAACRIFTVCFFVFCFCLRLSVGLSACVLRVYVPCYLYSLLTHTTCCIPSPCLALSLSPSLPPLSLPLSPFSLPLSPSLPPFTYR
jgi:hypothetical protein